MPQSFLRGIGALSLTVLIATASCKGDRSSGGAVATQTTPPLTGRLDTTLAANGMSFHIVGHDRIVSITPTGATEAHRPIDTRLAGTVSYVAIGDLNGDKRPELLVFAVSPDSMRRITLVGYSTNADNSVTALDVDDIDQFPATKHGYAGHDNFAIVNDTLVQTFPIYDDSGHPTGKTRRIQYRIVNGEGAPLLRINRVSDQ